MHLHYRWLELLCSWLLIILCTHQFFATHSTYSFLICTGLAIMGSHLVNLLPAYSTNLEFCGVWVESCFSRRKSLVLTNLTTSALCCIPCARFPRIWSDNLAQFLFTLLANHVEISYLEKMCKLNNLKNLESLGCNPLIFTCSILVHEIRCIFSLEQKRRKPNMSWIFRL